MKLIQHDYLDDPWGMMVACTLLNRTRGVTVRPVLSEIMDTWPTPQDVIEINGDDRQKDALVEILTPLGFYNRRASTLLRMAQDAADGKVVGNWFGIGQYAMDSWMIFVIGQVVDAEDKELKRYLEWCRDNNATPPAYTVDDYLYTPKPLRIMRLKDKTQ